MSVYTGTGGSNKYCVSKRVDVKAVGRPRKVKPILSSNEVAKLEKDLKTLLPGWTIVVSSGPVCWFTGPHYTPIIEYRRGNSELAEEIAAKVLERAKLP